MSVTLSSLFMYTIIGMVVATCGAVLLSLYSRRWTQLMCVATLLLGFALMLSNITATVWDVVLAVCVSVVAAGFVFLLVLVGAAINLVESPRAISIAMRLGLVAKA